MSAPSHLSENLVLLAHETGVLLQTATRLDDESIRVDSLCAGWTRAHVLSHIARNADALGNLVGWAVTGTPAAMYASPKAREADIVAGAARGAREILGDLRDSSARFAEAAADLAGAPELVEVEMRLGRRVLGGRLPTLRLMEVVFHHVDLAAGYGFEDADAGFVKRAVGNAVQRMRASDQAPSITLHGDDGDTWSCAGGAQQVTGTNAALLRWLARGDSTGVSCQGPLPGLPAWG